jgi:hypothetical protein
MDSSGSRKRPVADYWKLSNEPKGPQNADNFLIRWATTSFLKTTCFIELVTNKSSVEISKKKNTRITDHENKLIDALFERAPTSTKTEENLARRSNKLIRWELPLGSYRPQDAHLQHIYLILPVWLSRL